MKLTAAIVSNQQVMARWRHDIHRHPEPSLQEQRTASKVAELLRSFGFDEVHEKVQGNMVIGVLRHGIGRMIGLRADLDAQPIHEANDFPYRSITSDYMHAAGHDGHCAMLLGAGRYLASTRRFRGTIVFLFHSGHENNLATQALIEDGFFERYPIDSFYGLQSCPELPVGQIAISEGCVMGGLGDLLVKISSPHSIAHSNHQNPLLTACTFAGMLPVVLNQLHPTSPLLINPTGVWTNNSHNHAPQAATLKASVHYLETNFSGWLMDKIDKLLQETTGMYNLEGAFSYHDICPAIYNDNKAVKTVKRVAEFMLGASQLAEIQPVTIASNNFAWLLTKVPGACISIGNGTSAPLQSSRYDFNDNALHIGANLLTNIAEHELRISSKDRKKAIVQEETKLETALEMQVA